MKSKVLLFEMNKRAICSIFFLSSELSEDEENEHFKIFFFNIFFFKWSK